MRSKYSRKLFPFSPGIPWTIKNNKYIVPKIDAKIWNRALQGRDFIIACYGGLLESFFSLSYCEAIGRIDPYRNVCWMGDPDFESLTHMQGICKPAGFDLGADVVEKYPVPIFMDKDNNAYFNVLNDYIETKSFRNDVSEINDDICLKQIFKNCLIDWDFDTPKIRINTFSKYNKWKEVNKFYDNSKYLVVFGEEWRSMHDVDCLGWNDRQIRELSEMVHHLGFKVVSCGNSRVDAFYNAGSLIRAPLDIDIVIGLLVNSWGVLSKDIDPLFTSMMLSDSTIIMSRDVGGIYNLYENAEFIDSQNVIFTEKDLTTKEVYQFLEGST